MKRPFAPLCTGAHKRPILVQTCPLYGCFPCLQGDPEQLTAARCPSLRGELKDKMRAGKDRMNKRIDEVKEERKEIKALLIQALWLPPSVRP